MVPGIIGTQTREPCYYLRFFVIVFVFTVTQPAMSSEQLKQIKAKRTGHRGIVTKLIKEAVPLFLEGSKRVFNRVRTINHRSGYSSVTKRIPLQAIRPALNNFCFGFTSKVGAQATKG